MKTDILVADAMTTKPVICSPDLALVHVANLMADENVGSILVVDKNKLLGLITESDFVQKIIAEKVEVKNSKVKDFMTSDITTIMPNEDIITAIELMRKHDFRRLPVVENGVLKGMLTMKDILRIQPQLVELMQEMMEIREAYRKPVAKVEELDELSKQRDINLGEIEEF